MSELVSFYRMYSRTDIYGVLSILLDWCLFSSLSHVHYCPWPNWSHFSLWCFTCQWGTGITYIVYILLKSQVFSYYSLHHTNIKLNDRYNCTIQHFKIMMTLTDDLVAIQICPFLWFITFSGFLAWPKLHLQFLTL